MQTEPIQILIEAVEGNAAALQDIQTKLGGIKTTTEGMQAQQASLGQQFKASWMEINSAIGVAKQAYQLLKGVVDETVGTFVKYADQVRTISQVTGQSSEAVSRIIQLTDDYKIRTETLNIVMKKMATEGNALTIDSLAQLSDEYLKLAPGVERQTFLTKNFGREGVAFAEIMLAGGKAIRTQSEAISDNLILTDDAVRKARDYEKAQDDLADSVQGLKIAIGQDLTPPLVVLMDAMSRAIEISDKQERGLRALDGAYATGQITVEQYNAGVNKLNLSTEYYIGTVEEVTTAQKVAADAAYYLAGGDDEATRAAAKFNTEISYTPDSLEEIEAAAKALHDQLMDETGFETMYTAADDAVGRTKASFDWLGEQLTTNMGNLSVQGAELWQALLVSTGKISPAALTEFLRVQQDFQTMKEMLESGVAISVIVSWYEEGARYAPGAYTPAGQPKPPPGGDEGEWVPVGEGRERNTKTGKYRTAPKASGGSFSGWAMVGDKPGGGITPYTEWVYAPQGATVYNQAQMAGQSAPPMAAGGEIPPAGTIVKRQIVFYDDAKLVIQVNNGQTIDEVVDEVMDKLR